MGSHMESAAAGASRSLGAAHRRLGRVGLLTPMRAAPPRAAARAENMEGAANFRSNFNSARRRQGLPNPLARA